MFPVIGGFLLCPDHYGNPYAGRMYWHQIDAYYKLVMWADVSCCDNPVPDEQSAWGSIKQMYR